MSEKAKLVVGQTLYYKSYDRYFRGQRDDKPTPIKVKAVGRKWATMEFGPRISLDDLRADGGEYVSPGRCWLSLDEWREDHELKIVWDRFRDRISRQHIPPDVSVEMLQQAERLLFGGSTL